MRSAPGSGEGGQTLGKRSPNPNHAVLHVLSSKITDLHFSLWPRELSAPGRTWRSCWKSIMDSTHSSKIPSKRSLQPGPGSSLAVPCTHCSPHSNCYPGGRGTRLHFSSWSLVQERSCLVQCSSGAPPADPNWLGAAPETSQATARLPSPALDNQVQTATCQTLPFSISVLKALQQVETHPKGFDFKVQEGCLAIPSPAQPIFLENSRTKMRL